MLKNIVDLLKEVFWLKASRKKSKVSSRRKTTTKKKAAKKKAKKLAAKPKQVAKPASAKGGSASGGKAKVPAKAAKAAKATVSAKKMIPTLDPSLVQVGEITHYFDRIKVCVVKVTQGTVLIGDKLTIQGPKTKFVQKVWSMQIESVDVKVAKKGQLIGVKVEKPVTVGDKVYK